jgi:hypothetical protein
MDNMFGKFQLPSHPGSSCPSDLLPQIVIKRQENWTLFFSVCDILKEVLSSWHGVSFKLTIQDAKGKELSRWVEMRRVQTIIMVGMLVIGGFMGLVSMNVGTAGLFVWSTEYVDLSISVGWYTSIALDSSDNPHISYMDFGGPGFLNYARWNGTSWTIETVDSAGDVGLYTSIALDTSNWPHISYWDGGNSDLKYARWNGTDWSIETVDSFDNVGLLTSIALDSSDNPHISYYDITNWDLKHAHWNGLTWSNETVDSAGIVGQYTSIALDSSDNSHISYWDETNSDLRYAHWNGTAWSKETVDSSGEVGLHTSVALDSSDNSHISYFGYPFNSALKYAHGKHITPPSAPLNLSVSSGDQQITLTWDPPSFDGSLPITNYRIYRGTAPGGEVFFAEIGDVLTHLDTGLTNGQMYCYRVSAVNEVGEGPLSNEACVTPTTTPGAAVILQADLSGSRLENVTVKWDLSSDDGAGQNSVVGYLIYRGNSYDVNALGYLPIATTPNGTIEFSDNLTGEGDQNSYFYKICAVDLNNLTNCSLNQAGKFTRSLMGGPNLISIPLVQSDENIETVLQTVKWDKAWTYDSLAHNWKSHTTFKPFAGNLTTLNHTKGVWIDVTSDSNLTVAGIVPASTTIELFAGWNLIGFPSFNSTYIASDMKTAVSSSRVEGYDPLVPYHLRVLGDMEVPQAGYGYWIWVDTATVLNLNA